MTGATGYVGGTITEYAVKEGYEVHGLSRTEQGDEKLKALGATPVRGDLTALDILRHESSQADIILHLAILMQFHDYEKVLSTDAAAVDAMCEPLVGTGKPFIMTSGTALVAPAPNHDTCIDVVKKGIRVNSIRLAPFVYGRGGSGFLSIMMQTAVKNGESIYIGDGSTCTSVANVDDTARLYLLAAKSSQPGDVFNCTTSTTVNCKQIAEALCDVLKLPVRSVTQEEAVTLWNPILATVFALENRASSQKAGQQLSWNPTGIDLISDVRTGSYVEVAKKLQAGEGMDKFKDLFKE
ncbi:related to Weak similarity to Y.pseudotuberculosis CDP-3,6-dideoxy-D-glycero-L-glycero-4-hexulose-5-epimerase [Phialocephala subalpina]|uniref:Related to Weak similarity to Y.pseudotuberculosis CDP-3,6-dideoxy-D-glycero-L-glycero-4-hexulose-5-epimerase n=1 Tax=Phialocephala subalpina TaxID=576137 RepID=A0A1L7XN66_9HELO|nr:related to Weak similarity to Y.pseudotuberculosis CDP-3,6-dideoxy-D-glycero-L-glycero-4-hexulose-5-epimerase [Phialocephala subalpina]